MADLLFENGTAARWVPVESFTFVESRATGPNRRGKDEPL